MKTYFERPISPSSDAKLDLLKGASNERSVVKISLLRLIPHGGRQSRVSRDDPTRSPGSKDHRCERASFWRRICNLKRLLGHVSVVAEPPSVAPSLREQLDMSGGHPRPRKKSLFAAGLR